MTLNKSRLHLISLSVNKMSEHITAMIRQVRDTDYEDLARFFEANNRSEITRHFHPFPLTLQAAHQIACTNHLDRYYVAIWDERIVGLCMLRGWDEGFEIPSFGILVDHRHHGLGLGRQMTVFAISEARNLGYHSVRLSVYASNVRAMGLYLSLGFQEISRESCIVAGEPDEKVIMIKDLRR